MIDSRNLSSSMQQPDVCCLATAQSQTFVSKQLQFWHKYCWKLNCFEQLRVDCLAWSLFFESVDVDLAQSNFINPFLSWRLIKQRSWRKHDIAQLQANGFWERIRLQFCFPTKRQFNQDYLISISQFINFQNNQPNLKYFFFPLQLLLVSSIFCMEFQQQYIDEVEILQQKPVRITGPQLTQPPYCYIGAIFCEKKDQSSGKIGIFIGSGTLISPDLVLTAAHNVFSGQTFHKNFKFYLASETGISEHYYEVQDIRIPEQFKTVMPNSKLAYDYGVIKLKKLIKFEQFPSLIYLCQACLSTDEQIYLALCGYPSKYQPSHEIDIKGIKKQICQYGLSRQGRIQKINLANFQLRYRISTYPGQSGCPVMIENQIIAVHTGGNKGYNIGRITDPVMMSHLFHWVEQLNASQFSFKGNMSCLHQYIDTSEQTLEQSKAQESDQIPWERPQKDQGHGFEEIVRKQIKEQIKKDQKENIQIRQKQKSNIDKNKSLKVIDLSQAQTILKLSTCQQMHQSKKLSCCSFVKSLKLKWNRIQQIDFNLSPETTHLNLSNNKINLIVLSPLMNLLSVDLSNNCIKSIRFKNNLKLTSIRLEENPLHSIDVTHNKELQQLIISKANNPYIDLKNNKKIANLEIKASYLKQINLEENINLKKVIMCATNLPTVFITFSDSLWSNYKGYNFNGLKSKACKIILKVINEEFMELAKIIAQEWESKYGKQKCKFQVMLEK